MPTNIHLMTIDGDWQDWPPVLYSEEGLRSPRMITVPPENYPADINGRRVVKPGQLWLKDTNGFGVPFKATRVTRVNGAVLTVRDSGLFAVGDALKLGDGSTAVGTVKSIDSPTQITLDAVATGTPTGKTIALAAPTAADILGISLSIIDLDMFSNDVAVYSSCSVYVERMPYWDKTVFATNLPEITPVPYDGFAANYVKPIPAAP